jgi:hypothetical protein
MTYSQLRLHPSHSSHDANEPQTAVPAMLVGSALSLLLWSLLGRLLFALAA